MVNGPNFNDPMFIHLSDTPALQAKNKIGFINGTYKKPKAGSATILQWEICNALVLSWILNTVSREIFVGIVYATEGNLKEQFDKLKQLWDEFASLVILPSCECAAAKRYVDHDQQHRLLQFLKGLNESYASIRSQIMMMSPLPIVGQPFSIFSQEESHHSLSAIEHPPTVFYSNQIRPDDQRKDIMKCEYCNWNGHSKENCYKIVGYLSWHRLFRGQNKGGGNKRFGRDYCRGHKNVVDVHLVENVEAQPLHTSGHIPNTVPNTAPVFTSAQYTEILKLLGNSNLQTSAEPVVNMAGNLHTFHVSKPPSNWIVDTGANKHMVGDLSLRKILCPC
ncbi:uncharacterized protein [Primulina eburnea]|uniref:uncharacterized protein n=1 Tax=Primulina eburnea TaxID=1245227 RepID=UPI003C6C7E93